LEYTPQLRPTRPPLHLDSLPLYHPISALPESTLPNSFAIISFADPYPLSPIESHRFENHRGEEPISVRPSQLNTRLPRARRGGKGHSQLSSLQSALTSRSQITESTVTLSLAESALRRFPPASPLDSALTKTPGAGEAFSSQSPAKPAPSFHTLTKCPSRNSFALTFIRYDGEVYPPLNFQLSTSSRSPLATRHSSLATLPTGHPQ
jgi:hypothetical protein